MKKMPVLAAIIFLFFTLPALAEVCSTTPPAEEQQEEKGIPLEFINSSGSVINAIFISETGRNIWSENLLKDTALNDGEDASLDIRRKSILGLTDIKIIYSSGKEKIWKKLPILEIFEITDKKGREPGYERIKLGA
ncbi:MAG: hypothetical protein U2P59_05325 [Synergistota bacterium]|nr:hypothetical protein [Synergistota bacterium]